MISTNTGSSEIFNISKFIEIRSRYGIYRNYFKEILDVAFVLLCIPIWLPLLLILLPVSWAGTGAFPVYGHRRIGRNGKPFRCWKLRTMIPNGDGVLRDLLARDSAAAAEWERSRKLRRDPRVTTIGRLLRVTSLDELPQLINVLSGQMALVGPRPITGAEIARYGAAAGDYMSVLPGITGLWQIRGRSKLRLEERLQYDVLYSRSLSLIGDLQILWRTLHVVLSGTGV